MEEMSQMHIHSSPENQTAPITFESLNIRTTPVRIRKTLCGKIRAANDLSVLEWVYLILSVVALLTSLGLTIQRFFSTPLDSSDFTFGILLIITIGFCLYYVIDAVLTERAYELMVFVISNAIVLIYCVVNYVCQKDSRNDEKLARLVVICIFSPFLLIAGAYQSLKYCRSNNLISNTVGAFSQFQEACKMLYLCCSLLKFDFQLQLSMVILVMGPDGTNMGLDQKVLLGCGVLVTAVFIAVGLLGLMRESYVLMCIFYVLGLFEPGYVAYKFHYAATHSRSNNAIYESTFACGCFALIVWIALMVSTGYFVARYFNIGLKEKMFDRSSGNTASDASQSPNVSNPS